MSAFPSESVKAIIAAWQSKKFSLDVIVAIGQVIAWLAGSIKPASPTSKDPTPELAVVLNSVLLPTSQEAVGLLSAMAAGHEAGTMQALAPGVGKSLLAWLIKVALQWAMAGAIA